MKIGSIASQAIGNAAPPQDTNPIQESPAKPTLNSWQDGVVTTSGSQAFAADVLIEAAPSWLDEFEDNSRPNRPYPSPTFTPNTR